MGIAAAVGKNVVGLEEYRASFEASLREAPQDEVFFSMPLMAYLMLRSDPGAAWTRLEARTNAGAAHSRPASALNPSYALLRRRAKSARRPLCNPRP